MILNKSQAEAVYSAMCALNNVGNTSGDVRILMDRAQNDIRVQWQDDVVVRRGSLTGPREAYDDQSAFATAYGLDQGGEHHSAVAAAAGGLAQTAIER